MTESDPISGASAVPPSKPPSGSKTDGGNAPHFRRKSGLKLKSRAASHVRTYLSLLISLTCLWWVLRSVESEEVFLQVRSAELLPLFFAGVATAISYFLRAWRWPAFFGENPPGLWVSYRCLILGFFMNNLLPARIGEFVRAHLGGKATKQSRTAVLATIAGERLADGLSISILFALLFSFDPANQGTSEETALFYVAYLFAVVAIFTLAVLSQRERIFRLLERCGRIMPGHISTFTLHRIRFFIQGLAPMFRPSTAVRIGLMSLVIWLVELSVYYFVTSAFSISLSIGGLSLFLAAVNFSSLIPAAPGGIGVIEMFATAALVAIGVPKETAFAMVVSQHLMQIFLVGLPGSIFFFSQMGGRLPTDSEQELESGEAAHQSAPFLDVSEPRPQDAELFTRFPDLLVDPRNENDPRIELSVVIPAYNEEGRLPKTLLDVYEYLTRRGISHEIIVVDDGSTDETAKIVVRAQAVMRTVRLLTYPQNRGKGFAVRFGVVNSRGEKVIFNDADGATPIEEIERLERALADGAHVAIGSRALFSPDTGVTTVWYRKFLGRVFNGIVNLVVLPGVADTQCGFKIFLGPAAQFLFSRQKADGFSFDVEVLFLARRAGFRIVEVPVNWHNVPGSKVNLVRDSLLMFRDILRFRVRDFAGKYGSHHDPQVQAEIQRIADQA